MFFIFIQAVKAAKSVTGINNETEAIKEFRKKLDSPDNYFNKELFPANESDAQAHARCSTIEGAKKYCPIRWKALQDWFKEARMVNLKIKEQTFSKKQKKTFFKRVNGN